MNQTAKMPEVQIPLSKLSNPDNSHNRLLNLSFGGRTQRREWERRETKNILRSNRVEA